MADPFAEYVVPVSDPFAPYAVPAAPEATRTPATSKPQWGDQSMPLAYYLKPALPFLGGTVLPIAAMAAFAPEALLAKLALSAGASAVGAGAGSLAGDVSTGRPINLGRAGREAAGYGGATLLGEGLMAPAAEATARGLMRAAVRPTPLALAKSPNLIEDIIAKRGSVGSVLGQGGSPALRAGRSASSAELTPLVSGASGQGWNRRAADLAPEFENWVNTKIKGKSPLWKEKADHMRELFQNFVDNNKGYLDADALQALKTGAQRDAAALYDQEAKAAKGLAPMPSPKDKLTAQFNRQLGGMMQRHLETIPSVAERNATTQGWINAANATGRAETTRMPFGSWAVPMAAGSAMAGVPAALAGHGAIGSGIEGLLGAGLGRIAASPRVQSRVALALTHPAIRAAIRQSPRAALGVLDLLLGRPDTTAAAPAQ